MAPMASSMLVQLIAAPDWKQRHAALIALAQIAEGCAKVMQKSMSGLVDICLRVSIKAALHCLRSMHILKNILHLAQGS